MSEEINKNLIYDKFLLVEGLSYMGKNLVTKGRREKAIECFNRMVREMKELEILLKRDPKLNGIKITENKDHG